MNSTNLKIKEDRIKAENLLNDLFNALNSRYG